MADRLLVDFGTDGRVLAQIWPDGGDPQIVGEPIEVVWPLDETATEELRWYLEDYLRAPYGAFAERGEAIAAGLRDWGRMVFAALFEQAPVRDALDALKVTSSRIEVVLRAANAGWLGLPWELMWDAGPVPLALDGVGIDRSISTATLRNTFNAEGVRLRVLMVIARPRGTDDVDYQMIARPLMSRLEAVRGRVELVVLRPPTLDRLEQVLAQAMTDGAPFQVVHFDGHGMLIHRRGGEGVHLPALNGGGAEGVLVFEELDGRPDHVTADVVAQVLAAARIPLVVLNACKSGAVGKQIEAAVATRLLAGGALSVVAMAYTVHAVAAAEFMTAFYERLFAGESVSQAVTAGRARLARKNLRPSPKGLMPLADWLVPVHYVQREVRFTGLARVRDTRLASLDDALDELRNNKDRLDDADVLAAEGPFVDRGGLFYTLETASRTQKVIVLHGTGGTGKTELAKAFGRWWRDTDGVDDPALVLWHSFEPGIATFGLDSVLASIGLSVFGPDFALLDPAGRQAVVTSLLRKKRCLLIWDNFETVASMPALGTAHPPLDEAEQRRLNTFLYDLRTAASTVIITSRSREAWLGHRVRHVEVLGLTESEAVLLADQLLGPYPNSRPRRNHPAFPRLMHWLDGHPLSMRLVLPHLDTTDPHTLLDGLQGTGALPDDLGNRTNSLSASITYSFKLLDDKVATALTAISLLHRVAVADVLAIFSSLPEVPQQFADLDAREWDRILAYAVRVGLLTSLGGGLYRIHPALPHYLAGWWRADKPNSDYNRQHSAALQAIAEAHAIFGDWLLSQIQGGDAQVAYTIIDWQRHTMGTMLSHTLATHRWAQARAIVEPLDHYWARSGLSGESAAWIDRIRSAVENPDGTPPALDSEAGVLWAFAIGQEAVHHYTARRLDKAEQIHRQILVAVGHLPDTDYQKSVLSVAYHHLSMIAEEQGDYDQAENWCQQSLAISKQLGDQPKTAMIYDQLGNIAASRREYDRAEIWYQHSLPINEQLGDQPRMAITYHQLGINAHKHGDHDRAEIWYQHSLAISEQIGHRPNLANTYHQLGNTSASRRDYDQAEYWYKRSLTINEELGNRRDTASTYHQLGYIADARADYGQAEDWYKRSLTINEELGNRSGKALVLAQLGLLAEERHDFVSALQWTIRSVSVFDHFPHPATGTAPHDLKRQAAALGVSQVEQAWNDVTGNPLPDQVRAYLTTPET
ncbi:MAG TPA: hypothetical protein DGG94_13045 [Micromonosporaceae bacterium]|nr:hypothetical protein [Micromonosporaceae bacterium]HCU50707.1 hypothetical protein [Micromonosporaceae bacterium]